MEGLKKNKHTNGIGLEGSQKLFQKLLDKGVAPFVDDSVSEGRQDDEEFDKEFFIDIMEIKKNVGFKIEKVREK